MAKLYFDSEGAFTGYDSRVFAPDGPEQSVEIDPETNPGLAGYVDSGHAIQLHMAGERVMFDGTEVAVNPVSENFTDVKKLPGILQRSTTDTADMADIACLMRVSIRQLVEVL
jgi:hypothetical protein